MACNKSVSASCVLGMGVQWLAGVLLLLLCLPSAHPLPLTDLLGRSMNRLRRDVSETACARPTDLEQMFQNLNSQIGSTQFLRPASNGKVLTVPDGDEGTLSDGDPNETKTCPNDVTTLEDAPLAHRSLCPFYNDILTLPQGYYPQTLNWAKCKCTDCLKATAYSCEQVFTSVAVLRPTGCANGLQKYEEKTIQVPTSCTCAYKGKVQATTTAAPPSGGLPGSGDY